MRCGRNSQGYHSVRGLASVRHGVQKRKAEALKLEYAEGTTLTSKGIAKYLLLFVVVKEKRYGIKLAVNKKTTVIGPTDKDSLSIYLKIYDMVRPAPERRLIQPLLSFLRAIDGKEIIEAWIEDKNI
jgi:hypothetical protein